MHAPVLTKLEGLNATALERVSGRRAEFPVRLPVGITRENFPPPEIAITPEITELLAQGTPLAISASGGKDSVATGYRVFEHLEQIGHTGPRVVIHSDLGRIEWEQSLPACEALARNLGLDLIVVRRRAGDMIERWETRWRNNVERYASLACVKLILPWSTPALKFCTSEMKAQLLSAELRRRFPDQSIISAVGIRREESASRARAPVSIIDPRLSGKKTRGYAWHPIIDWRLDEVLRYIASRGEELHPAYSEHGCSRVSCAFCIMGSGPDLKAATGYAGNEAAYRLLVDLEVRSTFAFQGAKWLANVAPHLLPAATRELVPAMKERARRRMQAEARIPTDLLYTSGWPTRVPTLEEAAVLADVRREVSEAVEIDVGFLDAESIVQRYEELMSAKEAKDVKDAVALAPPVRSSQAQLRF